MKDSSQIIRILLLEDRYSDVKLAIEKIKREKINFIYRVVDKEAEFRKELAEFCPDIIISDYSMPAFDGMSALKITRSLYHNIPFIVLTGSMNEEIAVACMKAGANDYVIKEQITRLPFAVLEAIEKRKALVEKERVQTELLESEAKYRLLIENSNDAIYLLCDRKFEVINSRFEQMFGYNINEVRQPDFDFILLVDSVSRPLIEERLEMISEGIKVDRLYEFTAVHKNGEKREVEASVSFIDFKQGRAIQGIIRDVSERKKMIADLVMAKENAEESDRLKTAFLANMSHEIRTPMNGIMGFTELLKSPGLSGEQQQEFINIIQTSGSRMLETIDNLVDISKIETGQVRIHITKTNITEQLENLYSFFVPQAGKKGLQLKLNNTLTGNQTVIMTDTHKVDSVLTNLIRNAIKFTDKGEIEIGCSRRREKMEFYVKDSGLGIPANKREVIFNRFEQADISDARAFEGSGLGLSIAKSYIEMLGGEIRLESEEGKGSAFFFSIPVTTDKHDEKQAGLTGGDKEQRKENEVSRKLKILVAEDDETSYLYIATLLEESGHEILHSITGPETIEICRNHSDIDIIMMDIKMPGMDGYDATRCIREFNDDVIIIAQTAYALAGDKEKALEAGCNGYISKPIKRGELFGLINQLRAN